MMKKFLYIPVFAPLLALAEPLSGIKGLLVAFGGLVKLAIPIAYALCILFFFYGVANFIKQSGNPQAKEKNKDILIYGVIGIFLISSIWGIVAYIQSTLGISNSSFGTDGTE